MSEHLSNDPLHGMSLKKILEQLIDYYGFEELSLMIKIRCFTHDPSLNSSLKFLRKTPWARKKVEQLYIESKEELDSYFFYKKNPES